MDSESAQTSFPANRGTTAVIRGGDSLTSMARAAARPKVEQHSFGSQVQWAISTSQGLMADSKQVEILTAELGLPQLPEMVFLDNHVTLSYGGEPRISFNSRDALAKVSLIPDPNIKVAATEKWREARKGSEYIDKEVLKFDWTFTTDYFGTFLSIPESNIRDPCDPEEQICIDKLTRRDPILFFQDLILFEDELSDNGCAILNVKLRCMKTCFLLLVRFYLRVDDVIVRVIDSRFYGEPDWDFVVWEFTKRENTFAELKAKDIGYNLITKRDEIANNLNTVEQRTKVIKLV